MSSDFSSLRDNLVGEVNFESKRLHWNWGRCVPPGLPLLGLAVKHIAPRILSTFHEEQATAVRYIIMPIYTQRHWFWSISNQETYHMPDFQPLAWSYITKTQHSFKLFHNIGVCTERRGGGEPKTNKLFLQIWWKVHGPNSFSWNPVIFTFLLKLKTSQIACGLSYCCEQLIWPY